MSSRDPRVIAGLAIEVQVSNLRVEGNWVVATGQLVVPSNQSKDHAIQQAYVELNKPENHIHKHRTMRVFEPL